MESPLSSFSNSVSFSTLYLWTAAGWATGAEFLGTMAATAGAWTGFTVTYYGALVASATGLTAISGFFANFSFCYYNTFS